MIGNPASNLELLEKTFKNTAIQSVRHTDSTGKASSAFAQRATLTFTDGSKLYITEQLRGGKIFEFQYDWIHGDGTTILAKYHAEPHDDEDYQTETEPYHAHPPEYAKLSNQTRFPNHAYNDLFAIVEGIYLFHLLPNKPKV